MSIRFRLNHKVQEFDLIQLYQECCKNDKVVVDGVVLSKAQKKRIKDAFKKDPSLQTKKESPPPPLQKPSMADLIEEENNPPTFMEEDDYEDDYEEERVESSLGYEIDVHNPVHIQHILSVLEEFEAPGVLENFMNTTHHTHYTRNVL